MKNKIEDKLRKARFDLIICDSVYSLVNLADVEVPIALNCHNIEHVIFERSAQLERNTLKSSYAAIESSLIRTLEKKSCYRIALAMVCSDVDEKLLQELRPDLPIFVVPNVVDTNVIQPLANAEENNPIFTLLFQGGMDWYPNRDAVEYFANAILPRVRAEIPNIRFTVAGRNPPPEFVERFRSEPAIEFTGTVPDMRPYLRSATLVVVPLRLGGGTRIKILEACAAGRAVVSTSVGAEGLDLKHGRDIAVADDPSEFAHTVIRLLRNAGERKQLSESARTAVVELYSYQRLDYVLNSITSRMTQGQRG